MTNSQSQSKLTNESEIVKQLTTKLSRPWIVSGTFLHSEMSGKMYVNIWNYVYNARQICIACMHLPAGIYHNAAYTQICRLSAHNLSNIEIFVHNPELQKH